MGLSGLDGLEEPQHLTRGMSGRVERAHNRPRADAGHTLRLDAVIQQRPQHTNLCHSAHTSARKHNAGRARFLPLDRSRSLR